jgi:hypothetical protein
MIQALWGSTQRKKFQKGSDHRVTANPYTSQTQRLGAVTLVEHEPEEVAHT